MPLRSAPSMSDSFMHWTYTRKLLAHAIQQNEKSGYCWKPIVNSQLTFDLLQKMWLTSLDTNRFKRILSAKVRLMYECHHKLTKIFVRYDTQFRYVLLQTTLRLHTYTAH